MIPSEPSPPGRGSASFRGRFPPPSPRSPDPACRASSRRPPVVIPPLKEKQGQAGRRDPPPPFEIRPLDRRGRDLAEFSDLQLIPGLGVALRRVAQVHRKHRLVGPAP